VSLPEPPEGRTIEDETPCPATDGSEERVAVFAQAPPVCIEEGEKLEAVVKTSAAEEPIVIALDAEAAPTMVNNFVVLARYKYFDGLPFHRLVTGFVAQTGSSGNPDYGSGGPGYDMEDTEKPADGYKYQAGDVAMARGANGGPVSGSQFFIVATTEGAAQAGLTPEYPLFGKVIEGQPIATIIASAGDGTGEGAPTKEILIESVTIRPAEG
jgi:cyclophilin family peptidyl-prolyl cis-trans isomerase